MVIDLRAICYFAVLIVVVSDVLFGLDWQSAPMSPMPEIKVAAYATAPAAPTKTDGPNNAGTDNAAPAKIDGPNNAATDNAARAKIDGPNNAAVTPNNATTGNANAPVAQTPSQPKCDVSACTSAYRSFRESDCTYQPSDGPRRLCTKGVVPSEPSGAPDPAATSNTDADANPQSNARCNVDACAAAYGSFNPSDCTYQPLGGPRRLCAK
jgi:hypothetical protein